MNINYTKWKLDSPVREYLNKSVLSVVFVVTVSVSIITGSDGILATAQTPLKKPLLGKGKQSKAKQGKVR